MMPAVPMSEIFAELASPEVRTTPLVTEGQPYCGDPPIKERARIDSSPGRGWYWRRDRWRWVGNVKPEKPLWRYPVKVSEPASLPGPQSMSEVLRGRWGYGREGRFNG